MLMKRGFCTGTLALVTLSLLMTVQGDSLIGTYQSQGTRSRQLPGVRHERYAPKLLHVLIEVNTCLE